MLEGIVRCGGCLGECLQAILSDACFLALTKIQLQVEAQNIKSNSGDKGHKFVGWQKKTPSQ